MKKKREGDGPSDLDFALSRRSFFPALLREAKVLSGTLQGVRSYPLRQLSDLPDDQLADLIPVIQPTISVVVEGEYLVGHHKDTDAVVQLVPSVKENVVALNLFDGRITLGTAGRLLARQMGWDGARGFAHVRDLFLSLAGRLICVPLNSPQPQE
jgi:hypothetical protein